MDPAKVQHQADIQELAYIDLDNPDPRKGYILDVKQYQEPTSLKTTADGLTVLIPQPTNDPADPLNWTHRRKHVMLAVIIACTFLPDYACVTGSVTLIPQALYVHFLLLFTPTLLKAPQFLDRDSPMSILY